METDLIEENKFPVNELLCQVNKCCSQNPPCQQHAFIGGWGKSFFLSKDPKAAWMINLCLCSFNYRSPFPLNYTAAEALCFNNLPLVAAAPASLYFHFNLSWQVWDWIQRRTQAPPLQPGCTRCLWQRCARRPSVFRLGRVYEFDLPPQPRTVCCPPPGCKYLLTICASSVTSREPVMQVPFTFVVVTFVHIHFLILWYW